MSPKTGSKLRWQSPDERAMNALGDEFLKKRGALDGGLLPAYRRLIQFLAEQFEVTRKDAPDFITAETFKGAKPKLGIFSSWHFWKAAQIDKGDVELLEQCRCGHRQIIHGGPERTGTCLSEGCNCAAWTLSPELQVVDRTREQKAPAPVRADEGVIGWDGA